jgi:hypothetical protein
MTNVYNILVGSPERNTRSEELGVDGSIILKHVRRIESEGVDWIYLAVGGDQWRALMYMVMNLRVS